MGENRQPAQNQDHRFIIPATASPNAPTAAHNNTKTAAEGCDDETSTAAKTTNPAAKTTNPSTKSAISVMKASMHQSRG